MVPLLPSRCAPPALLRWNSVGSDDGESLDTATATGATPAAGGAATTDPSGLTDEGLVERLLQRLQVRAGPWVSITLKACCQRCMF